MIHNKYLHFIQLMRNERRPPAVLRAIQNKKLRRLIKHAYTHVPFYRQQFDKNNLHPDDIQSVDDLYKIPIIDKNDFHQHPVAYFLDQRINDPGRLTPISTSGSSGQILNFFVNNQYNQLRKAQFLRPYLTNCINLRSPVLWFRGRPDSQKRIHQKLGFLRDCQYYSGLEPNEQINIIQKMKPKIMRGYGSTFQLLASKIIDEQIPVHSPRLIFTDSELLSAASREKIKTAFQSDVIDVYGTFETENIAYECPHHNGYHIAIDCVVMEFIKNGRPAKAGEEAEIVCTVLDNFAFPFIRYNLHDLGTWKKAPCTCGRTFPLMTSIAGRTHHYITKQNGEKISSTSVIAHMWELGKYIHEFQIIQKSLNHFLVLVIPTRYFSQKTENRIKKFLQKDFPYATARVCLTKTIQRTRSGKFLNFIPYIDK